jgi:hypothetical protein
MAYKECHNYNRSIFNQSYLIMETNPIYTMERGNLFVSQIYGFLSCLSLELSNTIHLTLLQKTFLVSATLKDMIYEIQKNQASLVSTVMD